MDGKEVGLRHVLLIGILAAATLAEDLDTTLKQAYLSNVDALVILTSQEMLTGGVYTFEESGQPDVRMAIYNFPFYHHFRPFYGDFNFFVNGSAGISETRSEADFGFERNDDILFGTIALRGGGGIRYANRYAVRALIGFNFIYSYVTNEYSYNSRESETIIKPILEGVYANRSQSNYTYDLFWRVGYYPEWGRWNPYAELQLNYFDTKANFDAGSFSTFASHSGSGRFKVGAESPQFWHPYRTGVSLEGYLQGVGFTGDVRDTLGIEGYGSSALLLHTYLPEPAWIFDRFDLMFESVRGDGIYGYNIGVGAGFDFSAL
jgi:hypothetical protein